ncbi:MAG: type II toxin-antitoxin system prevent-host-death family antitoxin [Deltaproteobacteria bacterium]|nr:type II toxin-antitoxin system prevent-host-death family antitoxin [Deltaproteobacteria bacterium]
MRTMTAKDLKNQTGKAMRTVSRGEKVIVTLRGRPFALISPMTSVSLAESSLRSPEDAWKDIESALKKTRPRFKNVKEAMNWTRKR